MNRIIQLGPELFLEQNDFQTHFSFNLDGHRRLVLKNPTVNKELENNKFVCFNFQEKILV